MRVILYIDFGSRYDMDLIYSYGKAGFEKEFLIRLAWLAGRGFIHYIPDLELDDRILTYIPCYDFYHLIGEVTYRLTLDNIIYNFDRMFEEPEDSKSDSNMRGTKFVKLSNIYLR